VQLAWDAIHGVPLRFAVYSKTDSSPVLSLTATDISFGKVPASDMAVRLAPKTKVVNVQMPSPRQVGSSHKKHQAEVTGTAAVARAVPFRLNAPGSVIGMPLQSVRLVGLAGSKAAVAVYGRGLGALVVLEQSAPTTAGGSPLGALPTVSIGGVSVRELDTALGTLIQFDRGGVRYTVVGSVPQGAAQQAARTIG
jgi:hypothetical protein